MKKNKNPIGQELYELAETLIIAFFTAMLVCTYAVRMTTVKGGSMNNTFISGDRVVYLPWDDDFSTGDVAVAYAGNAYTFDADGNIAENEGLNEIIIKRVIAVGGQTVDIDFEQGIVSVDGKRLNEPYITGLTHKDEGAFTGRYPFEIPEGYVFVMGDNRSVSMDSRSSNIGLIPDDMMMGRVVFRLFPFDRFGKI